MKKIAMLATNGYEDSELKQTMQILVDAGHIVHIVSPSNEPIAGMDSAGWTEPVPVDILINEATVDAYDALVLPGGVLNPDQLRVNASVTDFVTEFTASGKPVAAICHAPWVLINAGVVHGKKLTSYPSVKADLENAGAVWVDESVVVDGNIITSRNPDDIPAFAQTVMDQLKESE
jgi:protease I